MKLMSPENYLMLHSKEMYIENSDGGTSVAKGIFEGGNVMKMAMDILFT